jgi:autotransporter-associated beta strand protein
MAATLCVSGQLNAAAPDLTAGGIPNDNEQWNLGPTGMAGWCYREGVRTTNARQFLVKTVEAGSPAAGIMAVNDVILGASGTGATPVNFTQDARVAFAQAITDAEERSPATLKILRWRAGVTSVVSLTLETLGAYSSTAPYSCPKSAAILEKGLQNMMNTGATDGNWRFSGLTLMAGNDPSNPNNAARQAKAAYEIRQLILPAATIARYMTPLSMGKDDKPWHVGPKLIALSEYYLKTGDPDPNVMASIRAYAHCIANGQSMFGTCGHYFSNPGLRNPPVNGPYNVGYGPVNNAALPCYIGLILANKCGLTDPEILAGIERAGTFYAQYTHLGCAGYGEHLPYEGHDTNGKAGLQALAFQLEGDRLESTRYYARASTAAAIAERDIGHTGSFFAYLYAPLGANVGGPDAIAYYFRETRWMYELARKWDGGFVYNSFSGGGVEEGNLSGPAGCLMATPMLLTYALPLRQTYLTGKDQNTANWITPAEMPEVQAASAHIYDAPSRTTTELLSDISNWSPKVRRYAARELKLRTADKTTILNFAHAAAANESGTIYSRAGACATMGEIGDSSSVPVLLPLVTHPNYVVRFSASLAIRAMPAAANQPHVNAIMQACITNQKPLLPLDPQDPMQTVNGNLCSALFAPHEAFYTLSLVGIDRNLLYGAIRACAANPQADVRNGLSTIYPKLTQTDIEQVGDALVNIAYENAPAGMGLTGARQPAISFLESNDRAEGVPLAIRFAEDLGYESGGIVDPLNALADYAGSSNTVTPDPNVEHFCNVLISSGAKYGIPEAQAVLDAIAADTNPEVLKPFKSIDWVIPDDPTFNLPKNWTTLRAFSRNYSNTNSVFTWRKLRGAGSVSFSPNGTSSAKNTTVVFDGPPGQYLFEVKMSDSHGLTEVSKTVSVTVRDSGGNLPANSPPTANGQSIAAAPGTPTQIILTGADPEGYTLHYTVTSGPTKGTLSGTAPHLVYTPAANATGSDSIAFKVEDSEGQFAIATVDITIGAAGPIGLAIYEPFNYAVGNLHGKSGASEIGLTGSWSTGSQITTESPSLTFGTLPSNGNRVKSVGMNSPGGSRPISSASLAGRGLLDNGATLWFSVVMGGYGGWDASGNLIDLALANNSYSGANIPNDGSVPGSGLGVRLKNKGVYAAQYFDASVGAPLTGEYDNTVNGGIVNDNQRLVVGKITWGATSDTIEIYLPYSNMVLPAPSSVLTANVDQSSFDTLAFSRGSNVLLDEIRFGASLQSVLQGTVAMGPDVSAPTPNPMTFAVAPAPASPSSITMTATPAFDGMGVEYQFTCTAGGGNSSGWQSSNVYTDSGLTPGVTYSYAVNARDRHPALNETAASTAASAVIPPLGTVPSVEGLPESLAQFLISNASLSVGTVTQSASYSMTVPAGCVLSQSPSEGTSAAYGSAVNLVISIGQDPVLPVLTSANIVDNRGGETVELGTPVTYTLTFNKDIDGTTLNTGDFINAGDAPVSIDAFSEVSPGVVTVTVTPNGTVPGHLRFAIAAGTEIKDTLGNDLNTAVSILDDTVISVIPIQPKTQLFTGNSSGSTDNWNNVLNWNTNSGPIPTGTDNVVIPAGKQVSSNSSATTIYSGNLSIGGGAILQAGYSLVDVNVFNCLGTPGSTTISMGDGSQMLFRGNFSPVMPAINLQGNAEITMGASTSAGTDPVFNHPITGPYTLTFSGKSDAIANLNRANNFEQLRCSTQYGSLFTVNANTAGSLGGNVTVTADYNTGGKGANLVFNAANAMSDTATLTLYGNTGSLVTLNHNDTIGGLKLNGVKQLPGTYNSGNSSWISGTGTLTVNGATMAYWNPTGGPSGTWDDSDIWNTQANLAGSNNPWLPGQIASFNSAGTYNVTLDGMREIGGLVVSNGSVSLASGELSLSADAPVNVGSGASLTIDALVSQNYAGLGVHKSGAGTLALSNENTFTGPVLIGGGVLSIETIANAGAPSALGQYPDAGVGGLYLAGGTLRYTDGSNSVNRGFTFTGNSAIEISNAGTVLNLGDVETAGPGTLTVSGGAGSALGLGNIKIVQGNNITLSPTNIAMSVASVEGYSAYPIAATVTLGGSSTGNVVTGSVYASVYPGSAYQQGTAVVKNGSGSWTIAGAMTASPVANYNVTVNAGTLTLSGNNTFTGSIAVNNGGKLIFDYGTNDTSKTAGTMFFTGGTLELKGGSHIEVVGSTTLNAGPTGFITRNGGTAKLRMNAITRNAGSSISFLDGTVADTDRVNTNGILGGYATIGSDWAVNSTNGTDAPVAPLTSYDTWTSTGGSSTANYLLNGSSTLNGALAANSLKISNTDVNQTLSLGSNNLTVTSTAASTLGGVLYAAGANNKYTINGTGALLASSTTGELIIHTAAGALTVNTPVVTSGATAGLLTKTGSGSLILGGSNVYTGTTRVAGGKLFVNGSLSNQNATLTVDAGATLGGSGTVGRNVTIADGGKLEFNLSTPAASHVPLTRSTSRTFAFSGSSVLTITAGANAAPGLYTLITGGNNITGSAPAMVILPPGWTADPPVISTNQLRINITNVVAPPANAAPTWVNNPIVEPNASEDAAYNGTLADDATDSNNDALTFLKVSGPAWLNIATNGTLSGTPGNSDVGANSFTVSVSDGISPAVETTLNITVTNTNDAPVWSSNPLTGPDATEDLAYNQDLSTTATDLDSGAVLAFVKVSGPSWLSVASNGIISGTPTNSDVGLNVFTVSVSDGIAAPVETTLQIAVINTNDAPFWTVNPISGGNTVRDLPFSGNLAAMVGDVDPGASLSFSKLGGPAWLTVASNGTISGVPTVSDLGMNNFTVGVSDGIAAPVPATLNINVINANVAPVAQSQSVSTDEDRGLPITLVATDADNNPLTYSIVNQPANGTLSGTPPNVTYTPDADSNGSDSFTFKVNDTVEDSNIATISITVNPLNDAPVFTSDPIVLTSGIESISYTGQTLAGRATDVDAGDTLTYSKVSGPSWLSVASNGTITGTPPVGSAGLNSFVVRATDSASASVEANLQITVNIYALIWDANGTAAGQTNGGGAWLNDFLWHDPVLNSNVNVLNSGTNKWVSGANATFGGQSSNGGAVTLASPTSINILTFNTFTGTYTLGTAAQTITLNGGVNKTATSGIVSMISPFVLGTSQTWSNHSTSTMTASSTMDIGSNTLTVDGIGTTSLTGVISGSGNIVKNGGGRLTFNVNNANTYTGTTTINGGVLMMANNLGSLGGGNVTLSGGILESYWGLNLTRGLGAGNGEIQLTGGNSGFGQNGGGQVLTINFGNNAANEAVWGSASFNPAILVFHSPNFTGTSSVVFSNRLDLNGSTRTIQVNGGSANGSSATLSGIVRSSSGSAGLVKTGTGILTLSAANTFTGTLTIDNGTLRVGNNTAGTLGSGNYAGNISIAAGSKLQIWSSASQTLSGVISGAGDLQKAHGGALTLSGANTYTGKTSFLPQSTTGFTVNVSSLNSVNGGTPALSSSSLGAPTTVANGTIDVGNSAFAAAVNLTYNGPGETTDRVLNFGFNGTASQTLTASGTGLLKFISPMTANAITTQTGALILSGTGSGEITQALPALPSGGISKTGTGTWILGGANPYTGPTAITAGKLFINGDQTSATGNVTVSSNATLGGTGILGGNATINTGGRLEFNLSSSAAGHDSLELASGKTLTFGGTSTLTITTTGGASPGLYTLINAPGGITGSAPGTLSLPSGWSATVSISGNSLLLNVTSTGTDSTPPTVVSITDDQGGASVVANTMVNYTVTFSEDMNATTVSAADFGNAGTAAGVIGTVTEPSPGVFLVPVTPTSAGSLQIRINAGAVLNDLAGLPLNTTAAIQDDTIITVTAPNAPPAWNSNPVTEVNAIEDAVYGSSLADDASDSNGNPLTFAKVSGPAWLSVAPNGVISGTPSNSDVGANSFTVSVTDSIAAPVTATLNISVINTNDAPTWAANPISGADATEDSAYSGSIAGSASDVDAGATLTFAKVSGPAWLTVGTNGTLSGTPSNSDVGANSFTVSVSDGIATSVNATLNITVINTNDTPTWASNPIAGSDATEDSAYNASIAGIASDVDAGANLTYAKVSGPAWLTVGTNGALSGTPVNPDVGANSFTVSVSDGIAAPVTTILNITVINTNDEPTWTSNPIAGSDATEDSAYSGTIAGDANDVDTGATLTFTKVSGPAWLTVESNGAISGTPTNSDVGANSFMVSVSDGIATAVTSTLNITVINTNDDPVWASDPIAGSDATEDSPYSGSISGSAADVDAGATLTYAKVSGPEWLTVGASGALSGTPTNSDVGLNSFTVSVSDGIATAVSANLNITVINTNDTPTWASNPIAGSNATEDSAYSGTLAGNASDVDAGASLAYAKVSGPAWLNVASNGTLSGTPNNSDVGTSSFTVSVTDGIATAVETTLNITVTNTNDAPTWASNPVTGANATEDAAYSGSLASSASDADTNATLTFAKVSGPAWLSVASNGALSGTPTNSDVGANGFTVSVTDGIAAAVTTTLNITVTNTNDAPVFTVSPIVAAGASEGTAYTGQTLAGSATDADAGDSVSYSKVSGPTWLTVASNGALSGTPPTGSAGLNSFVVRATDTNSATADATLEITVTGLPLPWVSSAIGTGMLAGSATHNSGTFTQAGSGVIGSTSDKLRFTYQTLTGDGEIIARISGLQNTGSSSRVGVMIRDTLATNSKHIFMGMTSSGAYRWVRRTTTAGSTSSTNSSTGTVPNTWVRLVRSGTTITAYKSTNGTSWTTVGSTTNTTFASTCYIGLAVGSGSDSILNTSQFSNVSVTP